MTRKEEKKSNEWKKSIPIVSFVIKEKEVGIMIATHQVGTQQDMEMVKS